MENQWIWPFELEEQIGAGGMGVVYRARYVGNDRRVALKLLPKHIADNPTLLARFQREMDILKDLRHPHIVHCFGGTCEGNQRFYAMELVEGGTIDSLLRQHERLSWGRVVEYAVQVCAALEHAHENGIVHRDLKPANLFLTKSGKIKLGDFGLALVADGDKLTASGKTLGTFHYMSPEQIKGTPPVSNKSDLYALGCVLFEMLTGKPPFTGNSAGAILNRHMQHAPPRVSSMILDCPAALDRLVGDLLEKDPQRRPADAAAVAKRLREVQPAIALRSRSLPEARLMQAQPPARAAVSPWSRVKGNWPLLTGMVLLVLVAFWQWASSGGSAMGQHSLAIWQAALNDQELSVRLFAARSLGEIGPAAAPAVPRLIEMLQDREPRLRAAAATALGNTGVAGKPALTALFKALQTDPLPQVREEADAAIKRIHGARSGSSPVTYLVAAACCALLAGLAWAWLKPATAAVPSVGSAG